MQLGMIGVGRMGGNMTLRLLAAGPQRVDIVGLERERDALVTRSEQAERHVPAHPANADHAELHRVYLVLLPPREP